MKELNITSWNVNGLRAVLRKNFFLEFIQEHKPDILCLQETKAFKEQVIIDLPDYEETWNSAEKSGYSGTAIFTKTKPVSVTANIPGTFLEKKKLIDTQGRDANKEGRVIAMEFEKFYIVTVYTPNAKDTLERLDFRHDLWDPTFLAYVKHLEKQKPVVFCGDLNVAHEPIDLARPEENEGNKGYTKEERKGFDNIIKAGFIDTLRAQYPGKPGLYTWWSHWAKARERNVGWRIDYMCVSSSLAKNVTDAFILPKVMGSDHCPVGIKLKI